MRRSCASMCAVVLLCAGVIFAHDSEPINTEFAAPFARGAGNVQLKFQHFKEAESYDLLPFEFEYGFASRQQFAIEFPLTRRVDQDQSHIRPGNIGLSYRYLLAGDNARKFSLSINPELELPTGDKRVAERSVDAGLFVHLDTNLAKRFWTHTNVGYETQVARIDEREKNLVYKFAAMYEARHWIQSVIELIGSHDLAAHTTEMAIVPEVIFVPDHPWEMKFGLPVGLTKSTPDIGIQLQLTWKFGKNQRE